MLRRLNTCYLTAFLCGSLAAAAAADTRSWDNLWTSAGEELARRAPEEMWVEPAVYHGFTLDNAAFQELVRRAPMEFTEAHRNTPLMLTIPRPDGAFETFEVAESPIMELGLALKFPEIRTYIGQGIDNPAANARFDWTPAGFHASVRSPDGSYFVDPHYRNDTETHVSYFRRDYQRPSGFLCGFDGLFESAPPPAHLRDTGDMRTGDALRVYRAAIATTGEYTIFHGGTVVLGMAAVVTAINRVNQVYENEFAIRLVLVADNDRIIYTNPASDPYSNNDLFAILSQNQSNLDAVIGNANYDIGHVFGTGTAAVGGRLCDNPTKARAVTGISSPIGDLFWVDYVCHELGHQFDGAHTHNGVLGPCGPNRVVTSAYEPGSGSTILSYAGICGADNLQPQGDSFFHVRSLNQVRAFTRTGPGRTCAVEVVTGNTPPRADAGPARTIPARTPFELLGEGFDADGDALTYSWEQLDLGPAQSMSGQTDNGSSPLFRSFIPATDPLRTFPRLEDLLSNTVRVGELLPTTSRTMNFRLTVRDNRAGGGGTAIASTQVTSVAEAGPFRVTAPNTNVLWSGVREVTWDVAGTNVAPINTANVNIRLSTDGGLTFPTTLATAVPNNGSALVLLPNISTSTARIRVEGAGNIYFDVSDNNFRIEPGSGVSFLNGGAATVADTDGNGNGNSLPDPGETALSITLPVLNAGPEDSTNVQGKLTSTSAFVSIIEGESGYGDLDADQTSPNATPFVIALDPAFPCGSAIPLTLTVSSTEGPGTINYSVPTGYPDLDASQTRTISPNLPFGGPGQDAMFTLPLSFNAVGQVTRATTTINILHPNVSELVITLISPDATRVRVYNGNGIGTNLAMTVFDDNAALTIAEGTAPYNGSFRPDHSLGAMIGKNVAGTWFIEVQDTATPVNGGTIQSVSATLGFGGLRCDPPGIVDSVETWEIF